MIQHPKIDPIIFSLGPFDIRWYGLMYLVGLAFAYWWGKRQCQMPHYKAQGWSQEKFSDLLFYGFLGVVIGGRVGYVLFYQWQRFLADPLYLFDFTSGGMSFHGGLLGVILVLWLHAKRNQMSLLQVGDFIAPLAPVGLAAGRIGNFINGELWGRPTDVPWGMVFEYGGPLARHPSQLYQAALEGILLFIVLAIYSRKPRPVGTIGGVFMIGYGLARFVVEYFREPDAHLGPLALGLSMGQWLSLPMIALGLWLLLRPRLVAAK
ncbi:prolipoprotein diacylglyceryl transferase [Pseudidiomarina taiwanensis]|uniref:Phosphatidylglycerol--prolipoprotein diacylglyceryl transferase n=1 Tax=Pseudidiomarina taiwanensis TaxID=337250 RepID=A0A432ZKA9_9GAMM|nr:prolipoprotein diacylglyceryl transferase [Pseudidiomarina taiwanensis]RUO78467.1 prolipoprotein diacylglyceryl transferase [Pseudidiomarina taiwanensis]